jgi:NADP-dependent 3-hydroxy acid dehydrogenase YdfG
MLSKIKSSLSQASPFHDFIANKVGGASGIGKAMVEYFHSKGARIVFGDVNDKAGKEIANKLGESAYS